MKKILLLFLISQLCLAQKGFTSKTEAKLDAYIANLNTSKKVDKSLDNWYKAFKNGTKPTEKVYQQKLIGLGIKNITETTSKSDFIPASFTFKNGKIALKNVTSEKHEQVAINSFVKAYFKNNNALKKEELFAYLDNDSFVFGARRFYENDSELYAKSGYKEYFIRQYKNHLYAIFTNYNFSTKNYKEVTLYKFDSALTSTGDTELTKKSVSKKPATQKPKTKSGFRIPNRWEDSNRMYHDVAIEELRETVRSLSQIAPYKNNTDFVRNAKTLTIPLNRDNADQFITQLQFFENYKVTLSKEMKSKLGFQAKEAIQNVNHYAAHALADIYMNKKQHEKAVAYYSKALENEYHTAGGTRYIRDLERIYADLAEAAFAVGQENTGVLYLLAIIAHQGRSSEYADTQLTEYAKTINTKKFRNNLVLAIDSVKSKGETEYTIIFDNQMGTFEIPYFSSTKNTKIRLIKSETYNFVNKK